MPYKDKEKQKLYSRAYQQRPKHKAYKAAWLQANPEKKHEYAAKQRARTAADPEKFRAYFRNHRIMKVYKITTEKFDQMSEAQGGVCAICGRLPNGTNHNEKALLIDHCHKLNKVRGLLCNKCNSGMGMLGDTIEHLESAIAYLKRFAEATARGEG